MPTKYTSMKKILSNCPKHIVPLLRLIINFLHRNMKCRVNFVEFYLDNNNTSFCNYSYTDFENDLRTMPCSQVLFLIHKNNFFKSVNFIGITKKENFYSNNSSTINFGGKKVNEYILLPLSILCEKKKKSIDYFIKNFSVLCLLFQGNCAPSHVENYLEAFYKYDCTYEYCSRDCKDFFINYKEFVKKVGDKS